MRSAMEQSETYGSSKQPPESAPTRRRWQVGRVGNVDRHAIVFLVSDYASYVTGSTLFADGGYTAR